MSELKIRNESRKAFFHDPPFLQVLQLCSKTMTHVYKYSIHLHLQNIATNINAQKLIFLLQFLTQL